MPKAKIGDLVRILRRNSIHRDKVGRVENIERRRISCPRWRSGQGYVQDYRVMLTYVVNLEGVGLRRFASSDFCLVAMRSLWP